MPKKQIKIPSFYKKIEEALIDELLDALLEVDESGKAEKEEEKEKEHNCVCAIKVLMAEGCQCGGK